MSSFLVKGARELTKSPLFYCLKKFQHANIVKLNTAFNPSLLLLKITTPHPFSRFSHSRNHSHPKFTPNIKLISQQYLFFSTSTSTPPPTNESITNENTTNQKIENTTNEKTEVTTITPFPRKGDNKHPLILAIRSSNLKEVESLLKNGTDLEVCDDEGDTPLLLAVKFSEVEITKLLLQHGAKTEAKDYTDSTSLLLAVHNNNYPLVKELISHGADIETTNRNGLSPLLIATFNNNPQISRDLLDKGANRDAVKFFSVVVNNGDPNELCEYIDKVNVNIIHPLAGTALCLATQDSNEKMIEELLRLGVDMELGNAYGYTPLFIAAQNGNLKIVRLFLDKGANKELVVYNGSTPLFEAITRGFIDVVKEFVERGAALEATDKRPSALSMACFVGKLKIVQYLLSKGVNKNSQDVDGATPLIVASGEGHVEVVKELLKNDVDVNLTTTTGKTAMDYAKEKQFFDIQKELAQHNKG